MAKNEPPINGYEERRVSYSAIVVAMTEFSDALRDYYLGIVRDPNNRSVSIVADDPENKQRYWDKKIQLLKSIEEYEKQAMTLPTMEQRYD